MTLRGKDFCNCEHAHMLRDAIIEAKAHLARPGSAVARIVPAQLTLDNVLQEDHEAEIDLWGHDVIGHPSGDETTLEDK